ncbi:MAG: DNA-binding protein, partial [Acinetobacter sp.]
DQNQSAMDTTINTNQTVRQNSSEVLATPEQTENKRIPVPEHVEPEQPKRGWLSRFFLPNG